MEQGGSFSRAARHADNPLHNLFLVEDAHTDVEASVVNFHRPQIPVSIVLRESDLSGKLIIGNDPDDAAQLGQVKVVGEVRLAAQIDPTSSGRKDQRSIKRVRERSGYFEGHAHVIEATRPWLEANVVRGGGRPRGKCMRVHV